MRTRTAFVALFALAGCFGGGPVPTTGADATVMYVASSPPGNASCGVYLGNAAFGSMGGYVVEMPSFDSDNGCGNNDNNGDNGGSNNEVSVTVHPFAVFTGSDSAMTPMPTTGSVGAGSSGGEFRPRVAVKPVTGDGLVAYGAMGDGLALEIDGAATALSPVPAMIANPTGLVASMDGTIYVAAWQAGLEDQVDPDAVEYPSSSTGYLDAAGPGSGGTLYTLTRLDGSGSNSYSDYTDIPPYACELTKDCVAVGSGAVYFLAHPHSSPIAPTAFAEIDMIGAAGSDGSTPIVPLVVGGSDVTLDGSDTDPEAAPVGLAANGSVVAWASAIDPRFYPATGCWISRYDGTAVTSVISTHAFSCNDVAVDATNLYFTIVSVDEQGLHGDGIGMVAPDGTFTSVALHMAGDSAGPRHVYADPNNFYIYAVAPEVIGAIHVSDLAGHHDFTP